MRALAGLLIRKSNRLAGEEIRFLRKSLGWSGAAFASKAGVERDTVKKNVRFILTQSRGGKNEKSRDTHRQECK